MQAHSGIAVSYIPVSTFSEVGPKIQELRDMVQPGLHVLRGGRSGCTFPRYGSYVCLAVSERATTPELSWETPSQTALSRDRGNHNSIASLCMVR